MTRVHDWRMPALLALGSLLLALVVVFATQSATGAPAALAAGQAKTNCGTFPSTSIYDKGRVFAIRGVGCRKAREVAKQYDHKGTAPGRWKCALAHGGGEALFSCGYGESSGNIRDWPHALLVKGVGAPGRLEG
jgi:hypothetical protein